jgi:energy-coupling factor transporter ATP-binding protein EcfA2
VYATELSVYAFRCFGKAVLKFQYPGKKSSSDIELPNVNLILGDNGGGKSSILRAVAIAVLAPILQESGFVANRMVRRPGEKEALLKVKALLSDVDSGGSRTGKSELLELLARFELREKASRDALTLDRTPNTPISQLIYDDHSPAFFVVGYGATRRVESGDYSESSARKSRGLRYHRVAGLFEDHVTMRPLEMWYRKMDAKHSDEARKILNAVLPQNVKFTGEIDRTEDQFIFEFEGLPAPFSSLSDGYKAFVGMTGDLLSHLADVCPVGSSLVDIPGIVLIDEIDLHLHPEWQRTILPSLANAFPKLQFICTSHSPLVASAVRRENVFVTTRDEEGLATIKQIEEKIYGRSAEQLLLSSYFGLDTTRPESFEQSAETLFEKAAKGDNEAALTFLKEITAPAKIDR